MLSIYISYILKDEPILVKGSLMRFRDFVYIDDVVSSLLKSINCKDNFNLFNICTGTKTTVNQALKEIFKVFNLVNYPIIESSGTPRDQFGIYGNPKKAKKEINWNHSISLEEGLRLIKEKIK